MSRDPSISETQGGPGTHCCPRKGVGRRTLPTASCPARMLSCSAPERQGETPENKGWGRQMQSLQSAPGGHGSPGTGCAPLVSPETFFFFPLVRETRPPWQSADSLETHKDRRRGEGKERESRKKSPSPKPRCQSPSGKAQDRQAVGARVPSHRGPLSPAHGAGGWGWGPGTRGCGALLHPLGWFRDPLPPNHFGRPSSLLPRT